LSTSQTANARSRAPFISSSSVSGIDGALISTGRATILIPAHAGSMVATRVTAARTAMILAARSDPSAMVLEGFVMTVGPLMVIVI
jgi:hypothetical protein